MTATTTLPALRKALVTIGTLTATEAADPAAVTDSTLRVLVARHAFPSRHKAAVEAACAADGTPMPPKRKRAW